ncbi:hypothetical protein D3C86_2156930 [compost metagenome]
MLSTTIGGKLLENSSTMPAIMPAPVGVVISIVYGVEAIGTPTIISSVAGAGTG